MVATVTIWDNTVGYILWDNNRELGIFEFDPSFEKKGLDVAPIKMPLEHVSSGNRIFSFPELSQETYKGLPGLLADSLPDRFGNQLINAWLAKQGRTPESATPVERLCFVGNRGMGALEYKPIVKRENNISEILEVSELVKIAGEILDTKKSFQTNLNKKQTEALTDIIKVGTSAGGARAKAIIAYNKETGEVRSGQTNAPTGFLYWLIKFDGIDDKSLGDPKGYGRIEYAYHQMALDCGIIMSECRLLEENGRAHFMTKRFDRDDNNNKLHMHTLCGMAHFDYNNPNLYAYEQVFQVMRELRLPYHDAEQMYRRMIFNIIARNQDDHTKNIAFLMDKDGKWKLSPAYDITYAYNPLSRWTSQHQLSVNGKRDGFNMNDLLVVAKEMNIKHANEIIEQIIQTVSNWPQYAKQNSVLTSQIQPIGKTHRIKF
jgi:serine/threonine-protein kinase HipA